MWEQIRANQRRSIILISGLVVVLLGLGFVSGELLLGRGGGVLGIGLALIIWGVMMGVYFTSAESILLASAGARELQRDDSPRLFNIIDEMKLASGLPFTPKVYLIDDSAPNAFAIGRKPEKSSIAVTTGLMHRLNRDELQGVIAHEIGHLRNQDVRFMTLAGVLLGSIIVLSEFVRRSLWFGGRGRQRQQSRGGSGGGNAQAILIVVALIFAILGPVMAQILYFACSRKREYLADASAAQFTRYPEGLASALEKISRARSRASFASQATAPMFIVNPLYAASREPASIFSSHPPTAERIRILRSMTGASLNDYDRAFRASQRSGIIGPRSLAHDKEQPIRPASRTEATETRHSTRDILYRGYGYVPVKCSCGLETSVPERYERDDINCVRCGSLIPLPKARETVDPAAARTSTKPAVIPAAAGQPPLEYTRTGSGWESFRCRCGRTVQLSPAFQAPQIRCHACGRQILVA